MGTSEVLIEIKSSREIEKMRKAASIAAAVLAELAALVKPGLKTDELDREASKRTARYPGATAAFFGYRDFPAHLCVSINSEVVHGIPGPKKVIQEGQLVSLDFGICLDGYYGDCATTVAVGKTALASLRLLEATKEALAQALAVVREGVTTGDIGWAVQSYIEGKGMNVIRDFVGHGIGRNLHEDPMVPNWGTPGRGIKLISGMTIAIEPMVTLGSGQVFISQDGWTAKTKDHEMAAHFEHTLLVTREGCEILTQN